MAGLVKIAVAVVVILFLGTQEARACEMLVTCTRTYLEAVREAQSDNTALCSAAKSYVQCLVDANSLCESAVQSEIENMLKTTRRKLEELDCISGGVGTVMMSQLGLLLTLFTIVINTF